MSPVITEAEVLEMTGLSKGTISAWMSQDRFPRKLFSSRKYGRVWSREAVYNALCKKDTGVQEGGFVNV